MQINSSSHLAAVLEQARVGQGLSMRQLSVAAGKSPPAYHFWKKQANSNKFEFETAFQYARALGFTFSIEPFAGGN
ncbi:HTH_XRE domain containing protein [uncultured Caudovirales phage]|uniref:HTH_XRE domain containing protein n=1 Tax=uncultured Caudovirales phage TaxID=2100421 RepID=A0A6J5KQH7_9CAUD|nr:HTH_XRE domain containing protein [uncultured Caudovirales phage]